MFKVNFMANQSVTDEDINAIGYNLSNTVYTTFENGVTYGIDALNEITKNIVGKGVKREYGDMCAVSLDGTTITVHSGQAFFENGATMTIDEEGISLELEDATLTNYVYLFHNTSLNVAGARCTTEIPSGIDVILLAEIEDGVITQNLERFCKSKILDAPNTPLVVYNSQDLGGAYYSLAPDTSETLNIENLSNYAVIEIGVSYRMYNDATESWGSFNDFILSLNDKSEIILDKPGGHYDRYWGEIRIQFNFENNTISIKVSPGAILTKNNLKITLYAGEVQ